MMRLLSNAWTVVVALLAIIAAIILPIDLAFEIDESWFNARSAALVTVIFTVDLVVNQIKARRERRHASHDSEDSRVKSVVWFLIDALSAFPFGLVTGIPIFALPRLLKLARVAQLMHRLRTTFIQQADLLKLSFFAFWVLLIAHWLACSWSTITTTYEGDGPTRYLASFYWVMETLTTIGYGETTPTNNLQRVFAIGVMLSAVAVYGYVIGNVASMLAKRDPAKTQYFSNIDQLNAFMKYRELPVVMRDRIHSYYTHIWKKRLGFDETSFLSGLPAGLRKEVEMHLKREILEKIPIFQGLASAFLEEVALGLKPDIFVPGEFVFRAGQSGDKMYFVIKGTLRVIAKDGTVVATLDDGDFFGELALFTNQGRSAGIQAVTYCDLYALDRDVFNFLLERFPDVGAKIREVAVRRQGGEVTGGS